MAPHTRSGRPRTRIDPARRAAYDALRAVEDSDAYLNLVVPRLLTERSIDGRDAAFTTELAHGTTRMQGTYDAVLDTLVRGGSAALQPEVRTCLRLGAHQILLMRVPDHAAVATSVELVRSGAGERPVRLVNAVLRRVASLPLAAWIQSVAPSREADLVGHLTIAYSHPRWVVETFLDLLGPAEAELLLAADNQPPLVTLAVRPGLMDRADLLGPDVQAGRWSPYAGVMAGGDPGGLRAVRRGQAGVQDEGSQLVALALARADVPGRDSRWLDLCAGPGGKAAMLAGLARQRGATLVASERQPHRARLVARALRDYPGTPAVVTGDGRHPPWTPGTFDRVIADVPCTGLGALRRRPEARWRRSPVDLDTLVPLQSALLDSALSAVRTGGVVAYVTCSPHPAESRAVVDRVLATRPDVREEDARALVPEVPDVGDGPNLQLWPHRHGTDAMYVSLLRLLP